MESTVIIIATDLILPDELAKVRRIGVDWIDQVFARSFIYLSTAGR